MVENTGEKMERLRQEHIDNADNAAMLRELYEFFLKPPHEGQPSRAAQIDMLLVGVNTGRLVFKTLLFVAAMLIAVSTTWEHIKHFFGK